MPFSSIADPSDIARAQAALDTVWARILDDRLHQGADEEARERLAYIVASLVPICRDETELVERAIARFSR